MRFDIDPCLERAETPPSEAYCDPDVFGVEREAIFKTTWLPVADPPFESNSILPFSLLPGVLDEELVFTRDADDRLHCLSNVCTHRGMIVASETGPAARLRCGYHGRTFMLDGRLAKAPGFRGAENFPRPADDLSSVSAKSWGPVHFVSLKPNLSFDDWIQPLREWVDFLDPAQLVPDPEGQCRYVVNANWKLYLDNYLEGFHIPTVHKSLLAALDVADYRIECFEGGSVQIGMGSEGTPTLALGPGHPLHGQAVAALYFHLFPNTLVNVYPWGVSINRVNPMGLAQTEVIFARYVSRPELLETGAGAGLHQVEMEDEAVVEATQKGIRSSLYTRGRYAPQHEAAVHHFHRWWSARIG